MRGCHVITRGPRPLRKSASLEAVHRVSYRVNALLWRVRGHSFTTRCACRAPSPCCCGPCQFAHTCRHAHSRFLPSTADVPNWPVKPGEPSGAYCARMRTRCAFLALGCGFVHPKAAPAIARIAHSSLETARPYGQAAVKAVATTVATAVSREARKNVPQ